MTILSGPRGWTPAIVSKRLAESAAAPSTYNPETHTVDAILSKGSPVTRFYGIEKLSIDSSSIDTSRVLSGNCPFLDSHNTGGISNALGRVTATWVKSGALWGRIAFNATAEGKKAEGMIGQRGELRGVSCGYSVQSWSITNEDGRAVDADSVGWNDEGYTYLATAWTLIEVSAVSVHADNHAGVRSFGAGGDDAFAAHYMADVRARMLTRQRMYERQYYGDTYE
jgi:hypothetical protein